MSDRPEFEPIKQALRDLVNEAVTLVRKHPKADRRSREMMELRTATMRVEAMIRNLYEYSRLADPGHLRQTMYDTLHSAKVKSPIDAPDEELDLWDKPCDQMAETWFGPDAEETKRIRNVEPSRRHPRRTTSGSLRQRNRIE